MKAKNPKPISINDSFRCQRRTRNGRCRMLAVDRAGKFCSEHLPKRPSRAPDFSNILTRDSHGFQTACGINFSLGDLYLLLAQGRISTRRANALTRICCALLRTLPAIDTDRSPKAWRELGASTRPDDDADDNSDTEESSAEAEAQNPNEAGTHTEANTEQARTSTENKTLPAHQPIPPGKEPLPATIDGYIEAVTKLKLNQN